MRFPRNGRADQVQCANSFDLFYVLVKKYRFVGNRIASSIQKVRFKKTKKKFI